MRLKILNLSWVAFFLTFVVWFNMAPFNTTLARVFELSRGQLTALMVANLALTIPARVVIGGLTDRFGPRRVFAILLWGTVVPCTVFAVATDFWMLMLSRVALSLVGAGFVVGIRMIREWFPPERVGFAEGIYAGWGNFGSAAASMSLPVIAYYLGGWRVAVFSTGVLCAAWGLVYWRFASDSPTHFEAPVRLSTIRLLRNRQMAVLAFSYFVTFGGELAVVSMLPQFMEETFGLSVQAAGALASAFAFLNLVARPAGGWISDRWGRVRTMLSLSLGLSVGYVLLALLEPSWGVPAAVGAVMLCSFFVQSAEGAAFAIAPFVSPRHTGQIAGMIGAAGNLGSVLFVMVYGLLGARTFFWLLAWSAALTLALCGRYLREPESVSPQTQGDVDGRIEFA